jgi:hypothetical protein
MAKRGILFKLEVGGSRFKAKNIQILSLEKPLAPNALRLTLKDGEEK